MKDVLYINDKNNFAFEFQPVTKLFEEQVKLHPDKCAVISGKESFTYAQLNEKANKVANALIEKVLSVPQLLLGLYLNAAVIFMRCGRVF